MLLNDAKLQVSNSLLAGFLLDEEQDPDSVVAAWYTSFTRLQMELNVHSLGGGMLIMIPGEVSRIRMPLPQSSHHLDDIGMLLSEGRVDDAYALGDRRVLEEQFGVPRELVSRLQAEVRLQVSKRKRSSDA
jgi:hypothetical protein